MHRVDTSGSLASGSMRNIKRVDTASSLEHRSDISSDGGGLLSRKGTEELAFDETEEETRTRETRVPERKRRTSADGALGMLRRTQSHYCARDAAAADASVSKTPNLERRRLSLRGERSGGSGSGSGACASPRCDDY